MYMVVGLILIMCFMTGCQNIRIEANGMEDKSISLNEEVEFTYEIPLSIPSIMVNQVGYRKESKKIAVFRGENLPEYFYIIDVATGKQVFTGKIESKGYNTVMKEYNSYGVFTGLELTGEYYIEADIIGQSYFFSIGNNIYENIFQSAMSMFEQDLGKYTELSLEETCYILTNLISAYEMYGAEFQRSAPDTLEIIKPYVDQLLETQNKKTGKLEDNTGNTTDSISAYGAGVLGKFSYVYRAYDAAYANECYTAARKAWNHAQKSKEFVEDDDLFFGATELFRITGDTVYHESIREYIKTKKPMKTGITDLSFYGEITYLTTKKKVDMDICSEMMKRIMAETEEISEKSREEKYLTRVNKEQSNFQQVLDWMVKMAVVDYVITNHEYGTVLENHLHYFLGRNPSAISYVEQFGSMNTGNEELDILANPKYNSAFIFMMSAILSHEEDGE